MRDSSQTPLSYAGIADDSRDKRGIVGTTLAVPFSNLLTATGQAEVKTIQKPFMVV